MSSLIGKIETEVEFKANADEFYKHVRSEHHKFPNVSSDHVQNVEVHEGDWETHGSIKSWNYSIDGKNEVLKEKVEIYDENKTVTLTALEGSDCLKLYKSCKITFVVVTSTSGDGGVVKVIIDYEKLDETIEEPNHYLNFLVNLLKKLDSHLTKA
ncbi:hypothetical protein ACFE04_010063 [Oxalis oulophora]